MPLLIIWGCIAAMCLTQCTEGRAMTVTQARDYGRRVELEQPWRDQVKAWVCRRLDCPDHVKVDEMKARGSQVAVHVSSRWQF